MSKSENFSLFGSRNPWFGVGTNISTATTIEEGIKLAELDWQVACEQLYLSGEEAKLPDGSPSGVFMRGAAVPALATIRKDTNKLLGVVKPGYKVLQNLDAFRWFQPFLDSGQAKLEMAGCLSNGRHIFILARITIDPIDVLDGDPVICYLLLANGHDGTMAVTMGLTPIRVECSNTLAAALDNEHSKLLRVVHDKNLTGNLDLVQSAVNLAKRQFEASIDGYKLMAARGIKSEDLKAYVRNVFAPKAEQRKNPDRKRVELEAVDKIYDKVVTLFESGAGTDIPGVRGSAWGAYNAINEYLLYVRGRNQNARLNSIFFGTAANLNQRAHAVALGIALGKAA